MFVCKTNISFFHLRTIIKKSLVPCHFRYFNPKIDTVAKRGSMLKDMIANKDKRKNWHLNIIPSKPKPRIFDKIHKPHRRRTVLNSLFIKNITDVISTGEIVPEVVQYGVEITGLQVSPCCRIVNVFWQVPVSQFDSCEDIGQILNIAAPKIRAELISRNVLGRVPFVYFLRDSTNAKVAAFEEAMQKLESEPQFEPGVIADDSFSKNLFLFNDSKSNSILKSPEDVKDETEKDATEKEKDETEKEKDEAEKEKDETGKEKDGLSNPPKPLDMKCDVFGLDHGMLMGKVVALKKRKKTTPERLHSAVISPESLTNNDDIFSKIPGICFRADSSNEMKLSREAIFKKFHIQRKMLKEKHKDTDSVDKNVYEIVTEGDDTEFNLFDEDFIEEETIDN